MAEITAAQAYAGGVKNKFGQESLGRHPEKNNWVMVRCERDGDHDEVYPQSCNDFRRGRNSCTWCKKGGKKYSIAVARPDLVERLVNPEDSSLPTESGKLINVVCNEKISGVQDHPHEVYTVKVQKLSSTSNTCPYCKLGGRMFSIGNKHPNLSLRVVNIEDLSIAENSSKKIYVTCDGTPYGNVIHDTKTYIQTAIAFTSGQNGCPWCGVRGEANKLVNFAPDLVNRMVNPLSAKDTSKNSQSKIELWCDGTVQGNISHPREVYWQRPAEARAGNGCPVCGRTGTAMSVNNLQPEIVPRLVNYEDSSLSSRNKKKVLVWCDGEVQSRPPHRREEYLQNMAYLVRGHNGCPVCSTGPSKVKEKINFVLEGIIDHIENLSGAQKMALVLRRHGIKAGSPVGQAILKNDIDTLKDIMGDLSGGETTEEKVEELVSGGDADEDFLVPDGDVEDADSVLPSVTTKDTFSALGALSEIAIGSDEDAVKFLVDSAVHRLWQMLYASSNVSGYVLEVRERLEECTNEYMCEFLKEFLRQYDEASGLEVPTRWGAAFEPNLMQKHMALLVGERRLVGNWSGTGSGKTASAILSAMVGEAKRVLVVCPNNTVNGWKETVEVCDPDAEVVTKTFRPQWSEGDGDGAKWLVINFDRFAGNEDSAMRLMSEVDFDMMVIDELHWIKERGGTQVSQRREILKQVRNALREDAMVLGMSATPVVNDLSEGKSLVSLIEGKEPDFGTKLTLNNIQSLHENMIRVGFRAIINPPVGFDGEEKIEIDISHLKDDLLEEGLSHVKIDALVAMEYAETIADLGREAKARGKGVMVYTEYLSGIDEPLTDYLRGEGLRVAHFTGAHEKADISKLNGNVDVLIGTQAIGTGVDGVQKWADTVVYATLPWTSAQFEQSRARVYRQGSTAEKIRVVIPTGIIHLDDGREWSWTESRWKRIQSKRDIASSAVDGEFPEHVVSSPSEATSAAIAMLKRLDEGDVPVTV